MQHVSDKLHQADVYCGWRDVLIDMCEGVPDIMSKNNHRCACVRFQPKRSESFVTFLTNGYRELGARYPLGNR